MFDYGFMRESPSVRIVKRVILVALAIHLTLATISGYRAIVQIYSLDVSLSSTRFEPGTTITGRVVTSGRTEADMMLELWQGAKAETLAIRYLKRNLEAAYDPRPQRAELRLQLTPAHLSRFENGPAVLRVSALGGMQWLRTPPPTVRTVPVSIAK